MPCRSHAVSVPDDPIALAARIEHSLIGLAVGLDVFSCNVESRELGVELTVLCFQNASTVLENWRID